MVFMQLNDPLELFVKRREFLSSSRFHLIPAGNDWQPDHNSMTASLIATQFPGYGCMDDFTTERDYDSQATWVITMLGIFVDMFSIGVCTIRLFGRCAVDRCRN